ncbi:hypothetical protein IFR09_19960 [Pseudomonas syringae]|nr:hypothetical protein [Pseudomonas syringae]MBD8574343.1 hypothetical protein [Pseudomonas syringae]MBD8791976.1 hypothetical protein [Pseudomonas syringae]MBD8801200.1 hypothetical protein [Pseudomonas syringae]MBD8813441.1 hypothetical protein [Pseudomonas syringae]
MMPSGKSRLTRWVGISSILVLIAGSFMALYVLMISASLPINISGPLVLGVLWLTNLVSALVTAIYGFFRRWPRWLVFALVVQVAAVVVPLVILIIMSFSN